jgi:pilus assembly protein CpaC
MVQFTAATDRQREIRLRVLLFFAALIGTVLIASSGHAAERLRVAVDKAEVLTLQGAPSVVLVANPSVADVVLERNQLLFIVGKRPGETRLFIYNASGKLLLERDLVVVPNGDHTVTITRDVHATSYSCDPRCTSLGGAPAAAAPPPAAR